MEIITKIYLTFGKEAKVGVKATVRKVVMFDEPTRVMEKRHNAVLWVSGDINVFCLGIMRCHGVLEMGFDEAVSPV